MHCKKILDESCNFLNKPYVYLIEKLILYKPRKTLQSNISSVLILDQANLMHAYGLFLPIIVWESTEQLFISSELSKQRSCLLNFIHTPSFYEIIR